MIRRAALALFALAACVLAATSSSASARTSGTTLRLVAYSTPAPVISVLIKAYEKTAAGSGVSFTQSYGSSGSQARAIVAGQPADIAFLSTGLDIDTIAQAGLISKDWTKARYGGIAADSQVVFVVRKGNPKHIHTWADLVKPGVQVVTPNPFSSGSAKWNIMAAYGAELAQGQPASKALAYLGQLLEHTTSQPSSGSTALQAFLSGQGDV